ncbi:biopolymer transporter ExbB [Idiomarina sp. MD25a]|uniref:MotA/TolQ/ExbB proton channel family protein n=1 Tax=Idiomarina sp. MD25a TaxID=1889913 RepID=UPI0008F957D8|nr:MotA/TolQ/ExbB proton channel family protein [Idiomarina sp. MD25a]OIN01675.1 biopolymer transporter ExbB [Idiomarina sp. MD25a]
MLYLMELWESIRDFIATGGDVLYVVMGVLFLMWVLMIERYWYLTSSFPKLRKEIIARWDARKDTTSWYAHRIREAWISEANDKLNTRILLIKTCVALCPLVGLLGTVTGMITVFEIMAVQGTGNPRLMASGISMATIPTMAGMVAALSGMFFATRLESRVRRAKQNLVDSLPHH